MELKKKQIWAYGLSKITIPRIVSCFLPRWTIFCLVLKQDSKYIGTREKAQMIELYIGVFALKIHALDSNPVSAR